MKTLLKRLLLFVLLLTIAGTIFGFAFGYTKFALLLLGTLVMTISFLGTIAHYKNISNHMTDKYQSNGRPEIERYTR